MKCPMCGGTRACRECDGLGDVTCADCHGKGEGCRECEGQGLVPCKPCDATGECPRCKERPDPP